MRHRAKSVALAIFTAGALLAVSPVAVASTRGIKADFPASIPILSNPGCTLGKSCDPLGFGSNRLHDSPGGPALSPLFINSPIYVYSEGVISIGRELPMDASIAGGVASFGDVNFFAPSFGASLGANVYIHGDGANGYRINWGPLGATLFQLVVNGMPGDSSLLDGQIFFNGSARPNTTTAYRFTLPDTVHCSDPVTFESAPCPVTESTVDPFVGGSVSLRDSSFYSNEVPEPATWALMTLGFGSVGAALRRGRRWGRSRPAEPAA
jgi:hypothetical protein